MVFWGEYNTFDWKDLALYDRLSAGLVDAYGGFNSFAEIMAGGAISRWENSPDQVAVDGPYQISP
jgi:hypothetical protein